MAAIGNLSMQQRRVVMLVHAFGWSQRDVASLLDIAPSTVKQYLDRGVSRLLNELEHSDEIDLDRELQKLGREILADIEPMTAEEVTGPRAVPIARLRPVADSQPFSPARPARRPIGRRATLVGTAAAATLLVVGLGLAHRDGDRPQGVAVGSPERTTVDTTPSGDSTPVATQVASTGPPRQRSRGSLRSGT